MFTLRQYLDTLSDSHGLTRTLGEIDVCRNQNGELCYTSGNSAAVFRIQLDGRVRSLRCYMRPTDNLTDIYGERLLPKELFLFTTPESGAWTDVVLGDWIEGTTLREAVAEAARNRDTAALEKYAGAFDALALELVTDDRAHGDLKPENIVVDPEGRLHLIDLDASFLPAFAGRQSPELGTAAYQHPSRTAEDFDSSLDDYPAALISTALHALVRDPSLYDRHSSADGLLYAPQSIRTDAALAETLAMFEFAGDARRYRIAQLLLSPTLRLPGLAELFRAEKRADTAQEPELFTINGLWGYRTPEETVIVPLYDCGFDFTEGLAAVRLGSTWHYVDPAGLIRISCPGCEAVKPFRGGRAQIIRGGVRREIDTCGAEFEI